MEEVREAMDRAEGEARRHELGEEKLAALNAQGGECKAQGGECKAQGGEFNAQGGEFKAQGGEFKAQGGEL
eukprot:1181881-Prorocentrum_minimum.AAC.4